MSEPSREELVERLSEMTERFIKAQSEASLYRRVARELCEEPDLNSSYVVALHARIRQLEANCETLAKKRGGK